MFHLIEFAWPLRCTFLSRCKKPRSRDQALSLPVSRSLLYLMILAAGFTSGTAIVNAASHNIKGTAGPVVSLVSIDEVRAELGKIEQNDQIPEKLRKNLLGLYRSAVRYLDSANDYARKAKGFAETVRSAPPETKRINAAINKLDDQPAAEGQDSKYAALGLVELDQELAKETAKSEALEEKLITLDDAIRFQQNRPAEIRKQLVDQQRAKDEISNKLNTLQKSKESTELSNARKIAWQSEMALLTNEIYMLEQELLSRGAWMELLAAQQNLVSQQVARIKPTLTALQNAVSKRQWSEAERMQAEAARIERDYADKPKVIRNLAESNAEDKQTQANITTSISRVSRQRRKIDTRLKQIEQDFEGARHKLEIAGLSSALEHILRDQRRKLPELSGYQKDAAKRKKKLTVLSLEQLRIDEKRRDLADFDNAFKALLLTDAGSGLDAEQSEEIRREARRLLRDRQGILAKLSRAYAEYVGMLGDLDFSQRQLVDTAQQYAAFLDERLLWIPSAQAISRSFLVDMGTAIAWFFSPTNWIDTGEALVKSIFSGPLPTATAILVFSLLFWVRRKSQGFLQSIGEWVSKPYSDRFTFTARAFLITLVAAAPWAFVIAFVGWRLNTSLEATDFAKAVGAGLEAAALPLLILESYRIFCLPTGIGRVHFGWSEKTVSLWRRHLAWLAPVILTSLFLTAQCGRSNLDSISDSLGRLAFMGGMAGLGLFFQRMFRPTGGIVEGYILENPRSWLARFRVIWFPAVVMIPFALVVLAAVGYFYSALQLKGQLIATVRLLIAAVLFYHFVIRWLVVAKRKLALIKLRKEREAKRAAEVALQAGESPVEEALVNPEMDELDIEAIDTQTRQLLRTVVGIAVAVGLWMIWAQVFPALRVLDQLPLWEHTVEVDGQDVKQPITLANLALAVVFTMVSITAARNLPGVLEIVLLRKLSVEAGTRYAITTLSRYLIVAIGIIVVFNAFGGSWSQIQWLVAALSVGLGFGLQEIFANFISGLIILFEQPVRIGDTVTVGDVSGTVSRIQIRATTITDFDRKELIVPNKMFITERLVNWTLTDPITRIVIPIGVAYGCDTELAHRVMLETVHANALVLNEPEPSVLFLGFGDSSLNFEVRVFARQLADRLPLMHELHMSIDKCLREHNIEIPFPQRDIHIRTGAESALESGDSAEITQEQRDQKPVSGVSAVPGKA